MEKAGQQGKTVPRYRGATRLRSFRTHFDSRQHQQHNETDAGPDQDKSSAADRTACGTAICPVREDAAVCSDATREAIVHNKQYISGKKIVQKQHNQGYSEQQRDCYQKHKSSRGSKNNFKDDASSKIYHMNKFDEGSHHDKKDQHGSIVSGRYIRKKHNNSSESQICNEERFYTSNSDRSMSRNDMCSENDVEQNCYTNNYELNSCFSPGFVNYKQDKQASRNSENRNSYHNNDVKKYGKSYDQFSPMYNRKYYMKEHSSNYRKTEDGKLYSSNNSRNENSKTEQLKLPYVKNNSSYSVVGAYNDDATQRERLTHHLCQGDCECLVCCDSIRIKDQTWHCTACFHIFHLRCIRKWARSPAATQEDGQWRCPACQNLSKEIPFDYMCFCGKRRNPEVDYHGTPHSCGDLCGRPRGPLCPHHCNLLCHPGPCPPCTAVVNKNCACGKTLKATPCSQTADSTCNLICDKMLNCGLHRCSELCHTGVCSPCQINISQKCFCGKFERNVPCNQETVHCESYACDRICNKALSCGHHPCNKSCHPGACSPCALLPDLVTTCPCSKFMLQHLVASGACVKRRTCLEPIPVCGQPCLKTLLCGPKEDLHVCNLECHVGLCPPCPLSMSVKCRCGLFVKEFPCTDMVCDPPFVYTCEKRCNRRKDCGRHKCLSTCCVSAEHRCDLVCGKKLTCGSHQCQETCHMGKCPTCWNVSFEELRCHCGSAVLYPPIHCGTEPPECSKPCDRSHLCDHVVQHTCHSEDACPPCTFLTMKWCFGQHKQCSSVPCFLEGISCGHPCLKPLPCKRHQCQQTCHAGACLKSDAQCQQPCATTRESCGHPCGLTCHQGHCPDTSCKAQVNLTCPCGHRSETASCSESTKIYHLMSVTVLASKMRDIRDGQSVDIGDVLGKKPKNNKLQCNEACAVLERNKRLAVALQIQNPELSCSPGPPQYSEFLKEETRRNPAFVADVHNRITELVQLAKQSKQKCRSHSFPPMNRDQRRVIHELSEFFGCETQSYDEEPKKNVVVTALKSKCWLPFASVMSIVQKETGIRLGIRRGPLPLASSTSATNTTSVALKKIDYFDFNQ